MPWKRRPLVTHTLIPLLALAAVIFLVTRFTRIETVIGDVVIDYLRHHAGVNCSTELNALLDKLNSKGYEALSGSIKLRIQEAFPNRFIFSSAGLEISS